MTELTTWKLTAMQTLSLDGKALATPSVVRPLALTKRTKNAKNNCKPNY